MSEAVPVGSRARVKAAAFAILEKYKASRSMYELVEQELNASSLEIAIAKTRKMARIFLGDEPARRLEDAMREAMGPR